MNYQRVFERIRLLCTTESSGSIDEVVGMLNETTDLPTTKAIDLYLGGVTSAEGVARIRHHLFHGTQMQRNYCTLFFARRNEWEPVNQAHELALIDWKQAYSR